jgi:hypothetical protein
LGFHGLFKKIYIGIFWAIIFSKIFIGPSHAWVKVLGPQEAREWDKFILLQALKTKPMEISVFM